MTERRTLATYLAPTFVTNDVLTGADLDAHDSFTNHVKRWLRSVIITPFESTLKADAIERARENQGFEGDVPSETYRMSYPIAGIDHRVLVMPRSRPAYGEALGALESIIEHHVQRSEAGLRSDGVVRTNAVYMDPRLIISEALEQLGTPTPFAWGSVTRYDDDQRIDLDEPEASIAIVFDPQHYRVMNERSALAALAARRFERRIDRFDAQAVERARGSVDDETPALWYQDGREVSLTKREKRTHRYSDSFRTLFAEGAEDLDGRTGDMRILSEARLDTRLERAGRYPVSVHGEPSRRGSKHGTITIERRPGDRQTYAVHEREHGLLVGLEDVSVAITDVVNRFVEREDVYELCSKRLCP